MERQHSLDAIEEAPWSEREEMDDEEDDFDCREALKPSQMLSL
ncbi:hypothetical protein PC116_g14406 [Phytophthora cactorum]|uniref:Uncharacterized protein n=1 Tax=Phytophthora cactorum TaxID=29920 RepID=A0A8T1DHB6_9STRA|nr:hypothetical protein Pcac1_g2913 [Phytophthora cactorum]KAG2823424.1 hypothetical protein PC112_g10530 [Phytophthora cactorum]KAG2907287.1 hypothetical protein PC114_g10865 [Phytophthora cactorum]KAG2938442.1 hypothetical protein PC117_g11258 [Phytophthora cactorum]KAG3017567.1 hypothetical protein PC119_g10981 [Phytophthora cactorum]